MAARMNAGRKLPAAQQRHGRINSTALIINAANDTGVPAQLLKNLFARESQFWPGIFKAVSDSGLGQLTENGADTTLLWNPSFYSQYCPLVLIRTDMLRGIRAPERRLSRQLLARGAGFAAWMPPAITAPSALT